MPGSVPQSIVWPVVEGIARSVGASRPAAHARLTTAISGGNNDLVYTAVEYGIGGEDISIAYATPAAQATTTVAVNVKAITVTPGEMAVMEVDEAGTAAVNGLYLYAGVVNGEASWNLNSDLVNARISWSSASGGTWWIYLNTDTMYYTASSAASPSGLTWSVDGGSLPVPAVTGYTSTSCQVAQAVRSNSAATALVSVADAPGNDGTGSVVAMSAANLELR